MDLLSMLMGSMTAKDSVIKEPDPVRSREAASYGIRIRPDVVRYEYSLIEKLIQEDTE